ncbi:MAG: hypothetical protein ACKVWR_07865 [Acidimicrobiales bacterium]
MTPPGGAANTARNLRALGASATLAAVVGADDAGLAPSGAWRQAVPTTLPHERRVIDAPFALADLIAPPTEAS